MGEPWQSKSLSSRNYTNESGMGCCGMKWQQSCHLLSFPSWEINNKMPREGDMLFSGCSSRSRLHVLPLCTGTSFTQFTHRQSRVCFNITWINSRFLMHAASSKKGYFPRNLKHTDVQFA